MSFKSGFVTIVGRPNVGKSTLVNALAGEKISIISNKPQTTRNNIRTVLTKDNFQMVFIDTPGIHKPKTKLGEYMVNIAEDTLNEVDAVLFLVEATDSTPGAGDKRIAEKLANIKTPVILLINKIDLVRKESILPIINSFSELLKFHTIIPISAKNNDGTGELLTEIEKLLPEGPRYFPEDTLTDQPEKILVSELIREKALNLLNEEVPHGIGVEVISFKEREEKDIIDIEANIYCEKDTHKGIIIGKEGKMLKRIGTLARQEMESLLGTRVFLKLWVKVKPDWRNSEAMLKTLGYRR